MRRNLLLFMVAMISCLCSHAKGIGIDVVPDEASLEAMIANHKSVGKMLQGRLLMEEVNDSLHGESAKQEGGFRAVSDSLDRKTRNLDYFIAIVDGIHTGFHTYRVYNSTLDYLKRYMKLVDEYRSKLLSKGRIWDTDYQIIVSADTIYRNLVRETKNIYKEYGIFLAILTGNKALSSLVNLSVECTTEECINTLNSINDSLDRLHDVVSEEYNRVFFYLGMRLGFYSKDIECSRDLQDILHDCYGYWLEAADEAWEKSKSGSSSTQSLGHGALIGHSG